MQAQDYRADFDTSQSWLNRVRPPREEVAAGARKIPSRGIRREDCAPITAPSRRGRLRNDLPQRTFRRGNPAQELMEDARASNVREKYCCRGDCERSYGDPECPPSYLEGVGR